MKPMNCYWASGAETELQIKKPPEYVVQYTNGKKMKTFYNEKQNLYSFTFFGLFNEKQSKRDFFKK